MDSSLSEIGGPSTSDVNLTYSASQYEKVRGLVDLKLDTSINQFKNRIFANDLPNTQYNRKNSDDDGFVITQEIDEE